VPGLGESMLEARNDQTAHRSGIAEADLRLGRVDVHVHLGSRQVEEQGDDRMSVSSQQVLVRAAYGAGEQAVAHRTTVDEQELVLRVSAVECRQAGEAGKA
jgi:hypothetical protein